MTNVSKRFRSRVIGFTLVELLVVIAIIGILVALLLPAIQAAREAARRTQCKDNVKNIALGCLLHVDSHGFLPSGGWGYHFTGDPNHGYGSNQGGSWMYSILTYVEESAVHDLGSGLAATTTAFQDAVKKRESTPITLFACPSRRSMRPLPAVWTAPATEFATWLPPFALAPGVVHSDYAANSGDSRYWSSDSLVHPSSYDAAATAAWTNTSTCNPGTPAYLNCQSGVMYYRSELKIAQITDGTSNTYLVGEKYLWPDGYEGASSTGSTGFTYGENQSMYSGFEWDNHRVAFLPGGFASVNNAEYYQPRQDTPGYDTYGAFGSAHTGSFNMAFCDGSVQSISYDISATTHQYLANRFDGQVVQKSNAL